MIRAQVSLCARFQRFGILEASGSGNGESVLSVAAKYLFCRVVGCFFF